MAGHFARAPAKSVLFSQGPGEPYGGALLLMNGTPQPGAMQLTTGTTYRFRFMNITPALNNLRVSLKHAGSPVQWRFVSKDSVDVATTTLKVANQMIAVGETYGFEYTAPSPQELTLEGLQPNSLRRAVQTLIFSDPPE